MTSWHLLCVRKDVRFFLRVKPLLLAVLVYWVIFLFPLFSTVFIVIFFRRGREPIAAALSCRL
jgi:hypothetical protein